MGFIADVLLTAAQLNRELSFLDVTDMEHVQGLMTTQG